MAVFPNLKMCNQQVVGSNPTAGLPVKIPICRGARRSLRNIMRYTSNRAHFKISFESRRCCNVREHVAKGSTVREERARSDVQCKVQRFDQVEGLQRF